MRGVLILLVIVLIAGLAWAAGLFNVDTSGQLKVPEVAISGGQVPDVQVETAKINVGSAEKTVEVPTVSIDKPGDDGSTAK